MIYIGYDKREHLAAEVCRYSILKHSPKAAVRMLKQSDPDVSAVYGRGWYMDHGQYFDALTDAPFSTEFSYSRFLVPYLSGYTGWDVFVDCDFIFRAPVEELYALANPEYALMCVQHKYKPRESIKMDGMAQTRYKRKNWSSMVLWNSAHPANAMLTPSYVNQASGLDLHGFAWLRDNDIGRIPLEWNYLVGVYTAADCPNPKAVHYTLGGPWFGAEYSDVEYADEWKRLSAEYVAA